MERINITKDLTTQELIFSAIEEQNFARTEASKNSEKVLGDGFGVRGVCAVCEGVRGNVFRTFSVFLELAPGRCFLVFALEVGVVLGRFMAGSTWKGVVSTR